LWAGITTEANGVPAVTDIVSAEGSMPFHARR
jgi:hypothetical protein